MREFICDTETTGLWEYRKPFESDAQPHICQLAGRLVEGERTITCFNLLFNDVPFIPDDAHKVHGWTKELTDAIGFPSKTVMTLFLKVLERADTMVCHNADFDRNMLLKQLSRASLPFWREDLPVLCTMKTGTDDMKLPKPPNKMKYGHSPYKWPSLDAAYRHYVDPNGFKNAHDAMADVDACAAILHEQRKRGMTILPYNHRC